MAQTTMEILLVHGLFGSLSDPTLLEAFGSHGVHAPDLIGYGEHRDLNPAGWTLNDQAEHLEEYLNEQSTGPVHLVGHSVGGAVGLLLLRNQPSLVQSYTSVEGNMTPGDAFWSAEIAKLPVTEIESLIASYRGNVAAWIEGSGVTPDERTLHIASTWLDHQPASTIQSQARAVVEATNCKSYLTILRSAIEAGLPVHLIAGANSFNSWDVPGDIANSCTSLTKLPNRGHLMMLEDPHEFAESVLQAVSVR